MLLRAGLLLFLLLFYGLLIALLAAVRLPHPSLFIAGELGVGLSLGLVAWLRLGLLQPLRLLKAGTAALRAQDFSQRFLPVGQPDLDRLVVIYNQMLTTLRKESLTQQEQRVLLERLIEASPVGLLLLDFEECVARANPAAAHIVGWSVQALVGHPMAALPNPWGLLLTGLAVDAPQAVRLADGRVYRATAAHFLDRGFVRRFVMLEELTQELRAQEKQIYEPLIRLITNEVNNSSGAVSSLLTSFQHYLPQLTPADQRDFGEALEVSITRTRQLANFVAAYARLVRLPPPSLHPTDLHSLLQGLTRLLAPQSQELGIRWHWQLALEAMPLLIMADSQQLTQALLNVCKNAVEAIGPTGGNVWVRTLVNPPTLVIENDGPPLTLEVSKQLFTPFFSTKPGGQGIGLVLVRDIALAHGFAFRLETSPTGRTAFTLVLAPGG
jgi:two-component system nitrogen regulation sensor histidine kinase NtrY